MTQEKTSDLIFWKKYHVDKAINEISDYVDPKRIHWLKSQQLYTNEHEELNKKLNTIVPNTQIVAHPDHHVPVKYIFDKGEIVGFPVLVFDMESSRCHDNCDKLYLHNEISNVFTGFALSSDGLWRYHSWGYDGDDIGFIVETTNEHLLYFGVKIYVDKKKYH